MSFFKTLETDAENIWQDIEKAGSLIEGLVEAIIDEEYQVVFLQQIVPLIKIAATNLQNESAGLDFQDFVPAVVAAVIPILPEALKDIEQGLIIAATGYIATLMGVSNTSGNAGNLPSGTDTTPTPA